jgi:hypothetical protein
MLSVILDPGVATVRFLAVQGLEAALLQVQVGNSEFAHSHIDKHIRATTDCREACGEELRRAKHGGVEYRNTIPGN